MGPPELRRYLRSVGRQLRELGPFERRTVIGDVRADIWELASVNRAQSPTDEEVRSALRAMPEPQEVAQSHLENSTPSTEVSRLAFAVEAALGAVTLALGVWILAIGVSALQFWAASLLFLLAASGLTLAGAVTLFVHGLAILSPGRASPWRFALLPAAAVCLFTDALLAMTIVTVSGFGWYLALGAFLILFLGGAYALTYATHQLPRLAERPLSEDPAHDYFKAVDHRLRDIDLTRRKAFLADLEGHASSAGIELAGSAPEQVYEPLVKALGSPSEVSTAYLQELQRESSPPTGLASKVAVGVAGLGIAIATVVLAVALSTAVPRGGFLTPLGLLGSVGLLGISLAVLGSGIRIQRAPLTAADHLVPMGALAVVAAIVISGVAVAAPSGGLIGPPSTVLHDVMATEPLEDGGLAVLWAAYPGDDSSFVAFPEEGSATGPPVGAWLTQLEADGTLRSTEPFPSPLPYAPLLDLHGENDTWTALFADSLVSWGAFNTSVPLTPEPWYKVDGRIDDSIARVAWVSYSTESGTFQVQFEKFRVTDYANGTRWIRSLPLPALTDVEVTVAPGGVLVTILGAAWQADVSRAWLSIYLLDEDGALVADARLLDATIPLNGLGDLNNGTLFRLEDLHAGAQSFWLVGRFGTTTNGTSVHRTWVAHVDSVSGSSKIWEIHPMEASRGSLPSQPGDQSFVVWQESLAPSDRLFVVSSIRGLILDESGWRVDPARSGLYLTSLLSTGEIGRSVRLGDAGDDSILIMPFLSAWGATPTVLIGPFEPAARNGRFSLRAYSLPEPPMPVQSSNISLEVGEGALLYRLWNRERAWGLGSGPGVTDFAGEAYVEDPGLLGWRRHVANPSRAFVQVPAVLRVDLVESTAQMTPLTIAPSPPDTLLELLLVTVLTVAGILSLEIAYPRWRLLREQRHARN